MPIWPLIVSGVIGAIIGAAEIFQRYRSEPIVAISNRWGILYVCFNAAVSSFAYYILYISISESGSDPISGDTPPPSPSDLLLFQYAFASGFGGAALLRSKLMNLSTDDGKDVALGPELIVQNILSVIDRSLDRERAKSRMDTVHKLMTNIDFDKAKAQLPAEIASALQSVPQSEIDQMFTRIKEIDSMEATDSQRKSYFMGYILLDLAGEKFLSHAIPTHAEEYFFD